MYFIHKKNNLFKALAIALFCTTILALSKNIGFFWDNTLLVSKMGHYLYNNGLLNFNFPNSFDPGHPPLMAFVYASSWKLFGKSLLTSHIISSIFLFGFVWQLHNFICHFTQNKIYQIIGIAFVFSDATILAQCFYIGQEIPQLFFFLLATNQLLKGEYFLKCVALILLGLCSLRGMMLCAGFFIFEVYYYAVIKQKIKNLFTQKNIATYVVGASVVIAFLIARRLIKGYLFMHESSEWTELGQLANLKIFIFNTAIIIHRYFDFGRLAIVLFIVLTLFYFKRKITQNAKFKLLLGLALCSTCIITIVSLAITNTIGHRYFTISFVFMHLLALYIIDTFLNNKKAIIVCTLTFCLVTGNLWQYPIKYAQGWDASLRSIPYFNLRNQAINYLHQNKIELREVGTFFPNIYSNEEINLCGDTTSFATYDGKNKYVLFANIYNVKPKLREYLSTTYKSVEKFESAGITVNILERK